MQRDHSELYILPRQLCVVADADRVQQDSSVPVTGRFTATKASDASYMTQYLYIHILIQDLTTVSKQRNIHTSQQGWVISSVDFAERCCRDLRDLSE